jgi:hypothetical protein
MIFHQSYNEEIKNATKIIVKFTNELVGLVGGLQVAGYRLLVAGYWLLVRGSRFGVPGFISQRIPTLREWKNQWAKA